MPCIARLSRRRIAFSRTRRVCKGLLDIHREDAARQRLHGRDLCIIGLTDLPPRVLLALLWKGLLASQQRPHLHPPQASPYTFSSRSFLTCRAGTPDLIVHVWTLMSLSTAPFWHEEDLTGFRAPYQHAHTLALVQNYTVPTAHGGAVYKTRLVDCQSWEQKQHLHHPQSRLGYTRN